MPSNDPDEIMKSFNRWIELLSVAMHAPEQMMFYFSITRASSALGNLLTNCESFSRIFYGTLKRVIILVRLMQATFMSLLLLPVINRMKIYETCETLPRASNRSLLDEEP